MIDAVFRKAMRLRMGLYTFLATISLLFAVLTYFAVEFAQARIWLLVVIAVPVILSVVVSVLVGLRLVVASHCLSACLFLLMTSKS